MVQLDAVPGPVFVDPSGRRGRLVRRACWLLGSLAGAYVVAVLLALVVPAGLTRLVVPGLGAVLPGPAAPELRDAGGSPAPAAGLLALSPTALASFGPAGPVASAAPPVGLTSPPAGPEQVTSGRGLATSVGRSAPVPSPTPGRGVASPSAGPASPVAPTRTGRPTSPPGRPSPTVSPAPYPGSTPPGQPRPRPSKSPGPRAVPAHSRGPR
ncbi:MAG: hypothetical protein H7233_05300 [Pseudorhodobacter sp.]|nr:hypothetical protein [Frankiaceae bacterium]